MSTLSTQKESIALIGYIRQNYRHNVPEAITKICLSFFTKYDQIVWRGEKLKQLLSSENGQYDNHTVRFNKDVSFVISVASNGFDGNHIGNLDVGVTINSISNDIDHVILCWTQQLVDHNMNILSSKDTFKYDKTVLNRPVFFVLVNYLK